MVEPISHIHAKGIGDNSPPWQNNITDAIEGCVAEIGNIAASPTMIAPQFAGELQSLQAFATAAGMNGSDPLVQTLNLLQSQIQQVLAVPEGKPIPSSLLNSLQTAGNALENDSASLTLSQSQFSSAMNSIVSSVLNALQDNSAFGSNSAYYEMAGQMVPLFNISVFEGPAQPGQPAPITEPNLNNIQNLIPALAQAYADKGSDPTFYTQLLTAMEQSLQNLQAEYPKS